MGGPVFNQPAEGVDDGIKSYAVRGLSGRGGYGVIGLSDSYLGVYGESNSRDGVGYRATAVAALVYGAQATAVQL